MATEQHATEPAALAAALDQALQTQRLRRSRFWWRLIALIFVGLFALGALAAGGSGVSRDHIARFDVEGVIADDPKRDALLRELAEDDNVKAVIVRINSPGGTTVGGEALYEQLRAVAEAKPTVAVMSEVAASAGYITALAADRIVARGNTITASVGVIFTSPNFSEVLDTVGVEVVELKSGARKAEPSPFKPVDVDQLDVERALIEDSFNWFIGLVEERRKIDAATRNLIRDGRILSGRQALAAGLVDEIGGREQAMAWLAAERDVDRDLPVIQRKVEEEPQGLLTRLLEGSAAALGLPLSVGQGGVWVGPRLVSTVR